MRRSLQPGGRQPSGRTLADVRAGALEVARDFLRASGEAPAEDLATASDQDLVRRLNLSDDGGRLVNAGALLLCGGDPMIDYRRRQVAGGELKAFLTRLPTLDPAETWSFDPVADCWATEPAQTVRTKKVPRNHVLAEATDKHPAQVQVYHEDVVVGRWTTTKFSGALPAKQVSEMQTRLGKVRDAVKYARETANATQVTDVKPGEAILGYVFG